MDKWQADSPGTTDSRRSQGRGAISYGIGAVLLLLLGFSVLFLLPTVSTPRESMSRSRCVSNLQQIGIALQTYHDVYKTFPPAFIADEHGVPMHSWRVLLLPYFEGEKPVKLHERYKFDEPWNGPNNRLLLDEAADVFRCPSDEENRSETNYLAVVGPKTLWPGTAAMSIRETTDGAAMTFAVVECSDSGINWLEPRDMTFNDATLGINKARTRPAIRSRHAVGANILFADGSVHFLGDETSSDVLRALSTAAGGEVLECSPEGEFLVAPVSDP